jgi:hypothetical protein
VDASTQALFKVLTSTTRDPQRWRRLAEEMRATADGMTVVPLARTSILMIADEYERLALRDERLNQNSAA